MEKERISFAQYLKCARERQGLNQTDAAVRIGISKGYMNQLETGQRSGNRKVVDLCADNLRHFDRYVGYVLAGVVPDDSVPTMADVQRVAASFRVRGEDC